ncbi:MAG: hypothetical protein JWQ28_1952 [Pedobacter sp.]|nr:hypothetical protein [Pedobacter sp.]
MVGKALIKALLENQYRVSVLSTHPRFIANVQVFKWDVNRKLIEAACFNEVDAIIHLAGENIAKEKWTEQRKRKIIDSRVLSTELLLSTLKTIDHQVKTFISASAVGFYGDRADEILTEESSQGEGFLAECCARWEDAVESAADLGLRVVKFRTGFIIAKDEGGLPAMTQPIKWFVGAALGTGKQWVPWIHMADMVGMYLYALENSIEGTFNACAPNPVTNKTLTKALGSFLGRPIWPLAVPAKVINLIMGEMSIVALMSTNTSVQKILNTGYAFQFTQLEQALSDIYAS